MRIRHCLAVTFVVGVVGLVACGGSASSSCTSYYDTLVDTAQRCNTGVQVDSSLKDGFVSYCASLATAPGANNFSGQLDTCVNQLKSVSCNGLLNCKIAGTLPDGTACGNATQCAGARCDTANATAIPNSEIICGKCASYLAVGAQCGTTGACDPATGTCTGGTCVAFAQEGQSCATAPCATNLTCDQTTKTCKAYPAKGQTCTGVCQAPYKCLQGTCADAVQAGGACPTGFECATGLTCDQTTKTCAEPTRVGAGQTCGFVTNQIIDCQTGLKCQQSTNGQGTCVAPKNAGDACTVGKEECQTFLSCINGTCAIPDYTVCK